MKQAEAKRLILRAWDQWVQQHSMDAAKLTGRETLTFFVELQDAKSPLLKFQTRGRQDKWQIVRAWLVSEARIPE
jgi:hypothetical protein